MILQLLGFVSQDVQATMVCLAQIFSTFFFLAIVGGAAFLWVKLSQGENDGGGSGSSNGDDPLSSARRIMDKYK